jgi:hypothetical protein
MICKNKLKDEPLIEKQNSLPFSSVYSIRISGPGVNSVFSITELEDFEIVETFMKKIRKNLGKEIEQKKGTVCTETNS